MRNIALVVFIACEFCYYLLIAQTGIVELYHSDISAFFTLPLGGILGTLTVHRSFGFFKDTMTKLRFFIALQLVCSLAYPSFNLPLLGILGLSLGMSAPLLIKLYAHFYTHIALALGLTYALATTLFTLEPASRAPLAIVLSFVALIATLLLKEKQEDSTRVSTTPLSLYGIAVMASWAFLDANLFETLSRNLDVSIWRSSLWPLILIFHLIGMATAYTLKDRIKEHTFIIALLFALSYLFYAAKSLILLSIVYPFVISYYNFIVIERLSRVTSLRSIGIAMLFTGWIAGGGGLMCSLWGMTQIGVVFIGFLTCFETYHIIFQTSPKRINHVS